MLLQFKFCKEITIFEVTFYFIQQAGCPFSYDSIFKKKKKEKKKFENQNAISISACDFKWHLVHFAPTNSNDCCFKIAFST